jgi:branched-chain amino acid transport system ATP-binding protein
MPALSAPISVMTMLECRNLSVFYGRHRAVENVSVQITPGEIVVMLGANGAGKSTLLRTIAGQTPSREGGAVLMDNVNVTHWPPHKIVEAGIALVPENRGVFAELTVQENLVLGAHPRRARASEADNLARVLALFPRLAERRKQLVRTMSGGERQMVALGRAMMSAPSILMLDEPSLGLSPLLCRDLFRSLAHIRETGIGIFLVEQNAKQSLAIADRGYLLDNGHIVGSNTAQALAQDEKVKTAYLGGG